jgi:hypothetical protein
MKKNTLTVFPLAIACSLLCHLSYGQGYLRVGSGYAFNGSPATSTYAFNAQLSRDLEISGIPVSTPIAETNGNKLRIKGLSFGKGVNTQAAFGWMFSEHFGAELALGYLAGAKTETEVNIASLDPSLDPVSANISYQGKIFSFNPSVVVRGGGEKVVPCARMGIVIGKAEVMRLTEVTITTFDPAFPSATARLEQELTGGAAMGVSAALGATYKLNEKLGLYFEANLLQMSWAPDKGEITKANVEGFSFLGDLTRAEKETEFVEEISAAEAANQSDDQPLKSLKEKLPFSNAGFQIGLSINL